MSKNEFSFFGSRHVGGATRSVIGAIGRNFTHAPQIYFSAWAMDGGAGENDRGPMTNVQSVGGAGSAGEGFLNGGLVIGHWSFRRRDGVISV